MKDKRLTIGVLVILALVAGFWFKSYFSPENAVRRRLVAAVESFEKEQLLATVQAISREYRDQWGQSYESVAGNISEIMSTFDGLDVDLEIESINASDDGVRVRLEFVISGRDETGSGSILGSFTDPCTATILWRKETPGWKIITTEALDIPELRSEMDSMKNTSTQFPVRATPRRTKRTWAPSEQGIEL
jgi:hypothetical protein